MWISFNKRWFSRFQSEPCQNAALRLARWDWDACDQIEIGFTRLWQLKEINCWADYMFLLEATGLWASVAALTDVLSVLESRVPFGSESQPGETSHGLDCWFTHVPRSTQVHIGILYSFYFFNHISTVVWHFGKWDLFPITNRYLMPWPAADWFNLAVRLKMEADFSNCVLKIDLSTSWRLFKFRNVHPPLSCRKAEDTHVFMYELFCIRKLQIVY